eukprot:CAMPEP_0194204202 /NCGR_PEP_ID=MMETSP0156-20130528/3798_1 /TAXON_ID=33649 /ORGANISM="Thalassionema nitzschioides, Strain L26-B" /LENGTH=2109 /DNA_ID=CAMNT_0038930161 /DNA_START=16 /DNA_END=6345 /DNA_ORIENTATION=-
MTSSNSDEAETGEAVPEDTESMDYFNLEKMQGRHRKLVKEILPKVHRIQREMRGRKYREVQAKLTESLKLLTNFQDELWPYNDTPDMPDWMQNNKSNDLQSQNSAVPSPESAASSTDIQEDTTTTIDTDDEGSKGIQASAAQNDNIDGNLNTVTSVKLATIEDDLHTQDTMHEAIQTTAEAFSLVLLHPSRTNKAAELTLDCLTTLLKNRYITGQAGGRRGPDQSKTVEEVKDQQKIEEKNPLSLLHNLIEGITRCSESSIEPIQNGVVESMLTIMLSPKTAVHEASMLMAIRATFHVYLITKSAECQKAAKSSLCDMLQFVFDRMEAYDALLQNQKDTPTSTNGSSSNTLSNTHGKRDETKAKTDATSFASQFHTDGYLLFRALCKLSSKELRGEDGTKGMNSMINFVNPQGVDPLALNSKILSLELLQRVLEHSGPAFRTGEKFIYAIQNYLCVSLLKNCMSSNTQVAFFSQKIFLMLVYKLKGHLKSEIEVFLSNIFLKVLESRNSSFEQKALVLESLRAMCSDPVLLTQIFLNYDCDMDANNLYKEIVHNLTKLSGKFTALQNANSSKKEAEQDFEISLAGLEVLVTILRAFLKAMGLPVAEEEEGDSAAARLRQSLQIDVSMTTASSQTVSQQKNPANSKEEDISEEDFKIAAKAPASEASKIVDAFETKRAQQQNFEIGVVKFTLSLKSGLKYFIDNGFVSLDAKSIALFFYENKDKLDKTMIGEALGREPDASFVKEEGVDPEKGGIGFWYLILNHYIDSFDFTDLLFDDAIRLFQSGFRLPGEAQKIDRIMEKFAERYTHQNLDVFPSADTAFILAFSVIMLNTDLHNPNIKEEKKMTLESFIRNNRGIADGEDLPEEFLTGIFKRIKSSPFSLKEDDEARQKMKEQELLESNYFFEGPSFFGGSAEDRKKEKFRKERTEMMNATEQLFKKRSTKGKAAIAIISANAQVTDSIDPKDVVKPMFDVTWGPLIGTLSQVLECSTDERSISVCLNGFVYAVRIAAHSQMSLARDTFVNSLAKFTSLGSIKEMRYKNIESIRTLLSISVIDGEYLNESWGPVLQCISQLSRLRLFGSGLDSDEAFLHDESEPAKITKNPSNHDAFRQQAKADTDRETEETNSRAVVAAFNDVLIDKVFSSTVNLSSRSIAHFIEQLVEVSAMEIAGDSKRGISGVTASSKKATKSGDTTGDEGSRIFSLQRLVEVADFNMDVRPRLAWAQVWEIMANHFSKIGCHENAKVSIFAIDSLKQLSFKFLEKPELSEFNFQRIFLRPFLQLMENSRTREDIRELILRCVDNMIRTISHNLRSGWKIFFSILTASARDPSERINTLGLAILQSLLDEHLHQLCRLHEDDATSAPISANDVGELLPIQKHNRNANVDDFVGLCRASISFIETNDSSSKIPIGLSMRALCHAACYADLVAEGRVLPPVSGSQCTNEDQTGYTYEGLDEKEGLDMVLWRTLLDGLANGIKSTRPSNAGGVGCLVQRGSVLALRAILLRYGHHFSTAQWNALLTQMLLPAIQAAAESDESPVIRITSESPSISSVDFLAEAQALPPSHHNEGLRKFAEQSSSAERAPSRPLGEAELLVEASFADMRHGGDGNLSSAYELLSKDVQAEVGEQPFPDSWIATTAPIAFGTLTDILSEVALKRGPEGRNVLWPLIEEQFYLWCIGREKTGGGVWQPCEAIVRISCREINRFAIHLKSCLSSLESEERMAWLSTVLKSFARILSRLVSIEGSIMDELIRVKSVAYGPYDNEDPKIEPQVELGKVETEIIIYTPFGKGKLAERRKDKCNSNGGTSCTYVKEVIQLDFGGKLYRPAPGIKPIIENGATSQTPVTEMVENGERLMPKSMDEITRESWWQHLVPSLKIRCVGAHCIQNYLHDLLSFYAPLASEEDIGLLQVSLDESRLLAADASTHEDLSHAFQEAMFSQWGDGVEEVEEALSSIGGMSHRRGSEMFFLTQEAGATKNIIHMLSILYQVDKRDDQTWDCEAYSESRLLEHIKEVLQKFIRSEATDGHLIDPNIWRNASESGGKLAIYCTSFAAVVVKILSIMLSMSREKFSKHHREFFPVLCSLVLVQSDEIRCLVKEVLELQVAPELGVSI